MQIKDIYITMHKSKLKLETKTRAKAIKMPVEEKKGEDP